MKNIHGVALSAVIGIIAVFLSSFIPVGSVALAIVAGAVVGNSVKIKEKYNKGITYSEKVLLAYAIALMGINLDFVILSHLGVKSLVLIVLAIIVTILSALYFAKLFKFDRDFSLILGIGNGVCGSAAIAATKDIVGLDKQKAGLSVAIVNFLGTVGIFILPLIGTFLLNFNDLETGVLIGNTLQAVGQVVAAGFSVNEGVGQSATIVKMGRILMLTPVILLLIYFIAKKSSAGQKASLQVPGFIMGFILFSILATTKLLPQFAVEGISTLSHYLLLIAMAAIGLKINFKTIKEHGSKAFLIAIYIFIVQVIFSTAFILIFF